MYFFLYIKKKAYICIVKPIKLFIMKTRMISICVSSIPGTTYCTVSAGCGQAIVISDWLKLPHDCLREETPGVYVLPRAAAVATVLSRIGSRDFQVVTHNVYMTGFALTVECDDSQFKFDVNPDSDDACGQK